jgi:hypothetical protein
LFEVAVHGNGHVLPMLTDVQTRIPRNILISIRQMKVDGLDSKLSEIGGENDEPFFLRRTPRLWIRDLERHFGR